MCKGDEERDMIKGILAYDVKLLMIHLRTYLLSRASHLKMFQVVAAVLSMDLFIQSTYQVSKLGLIVQDL